MKHPIITRSDLSEFLEDKLAYCHSFKIVDRDTPGMVQVVVHVDRALGTEEDRREHFEQLKSELKERTPLGITVEFTEVLEGPYR